MPLPKTYTERISVNMRGEHRAELQEHLPENIGVGAALRDAGLRAAGRADLVSEKRDESGHRRKRSEDIPEQVAVAVHLTATQKAVLDTAAKSKGVSRAVMLHDALRAELGLEPVEAANELGGWTRGKRRSRKPPR